MLNRFKNQPHTKLFMLYNTAFMLYMLVSVVSFIWLLTGVRALTMLTLSAGVTLIALYDCYKIKYKPSVLHWLTLAFFAWVTIAIIIAMPQSGTSDIPHFVLYCCFAFPVFFTCVTFTRAQFITQWKWFCYAYCFVMTILSAIGIYCFTANTSVTVSSSILGDISIQSSGVNLWIFYHYNTSASQIAVAVLLAFFIIVCAKQLWTRVLFVVQFIILYTALALTYSRTSMVATSLCLAVCAFYFIWHAKKRQTNFAFIQNMVARFIACTLVFAVVSIASYTALVQINTQISFLRNSIIVKTTSTQATPASADEISQTSVATLSVRTLSTANVETATPKALAQMGTSSANITLLSDASLTQEELDAQTQVELEARSLASLWHVSARFTIWKNTLSALVENPAWLLTGLSPINVTQITIEASGATATHAHNIFLQVLAAVGLPGLFLFTALFCTALFGALQLFFSPQYSFAEGCFPLVQIALLTALGMQEAIILTLPTCMAIFGFFIVCAQITVIKRDITMHQNETM